MSATEVIPWGAPKMITALEEQLKDATALLNSRIIKTEEGRELVTRHVRLLETLVHGEPKTPLLSRHHG